MITQKLIDKGKYWTKAWSLVDGCTPVSEACDKCWLANMAYRFECKHACADCNKHETEKCHALTKKNQSTGKVEFNGHVVCREDRLIIPLKARNPQVFAIWSDITHEKVPDEFIYFAFDAADRYRNHVYLFLTKRIKRLVSLLDGRRLPPHIYMGTTAENQHTADERIPYLLKIEGKRFLSIEPMLDKINIRMYLSQIHQVICGGETGHNARPLNPEWVRSLRDQCAEFGIPFFFKKWGGRIKGRELDGRTHDELIWIKK